MSNSFTVAESDSDSGGGSSNYTPVRTINLVPAVTLKAKDADGQAEQLFSLLDEVRNKIDQLSEQAEEDIDKRETLRANISVDFEDMLNQLIEDLEGASEDLDEELS